MDDKSVACLKSIALLPIHHCHDGGKKYDIRFDLASRRLHVLTLPGHSSALQPRVSSRIDNQHTSLQWPISTCSTTKPHPDPQGMSLPSLSHRSKTSPLDKGHLAQRTAMTTLRLFDQIRLRIMLHAIWYLPWGLQSSAPAIITFLPRFSIDRLSSPRRRDPLHRAKMPTHINTVRPLLGRQRRVNNRPQFAAPQCN